MENTEIQEQDLPEIEPLTYKEQLIFLSAMSREEEICKNLDAEQPEPPSFLLIPICEEIVRKVKAALWQ